MADVMWNNTTYEVPLIADKLVLEEAPAGGYGYQLLKRAMDCIGAGIGLLLLSPLFAVMAVLIKLESAGPVLFSQTRIGKDGVEFRCWKFRSMFRDAEQRKQELLQLNQGLSLKIFTPRAWLRLQGEQKSLAYCQFPQRNH